VFVPQGDERAIQRRDNYRAPEQMRQACELSAVGEKPNPREQPVPVVNLTAHEGECHGLRVTHVAGHIQQVLPQPHSAHGRVESSAGTKELNPRRDGEDELAERPAQHPDGLAEQAEENVSRLVEEKVCPVKKMVVVGEDEPKGVGNQCEEEERSSRHPTSRRRMPLYRRAATRG